jgi:hypothetical protein
MAIYSNKKNTFIKTCCKISFVIIWLLRPPLPLLLMSRLWPICIRCQGGPPMKEELRGKGPNCISNFHHHNINGGAVDNTVHDVTGRRSHVRAIYPWDIYDGNNKKQEFLWCKPSRRCMDWWKNRESKISWHCPFNEHYADENTVYILSQDSQIVSCNCLTSSRV